MWGRERIRSRYRTRTKVLVAITIGALVASAFLSAIIIPLYTYPGVDWNAIIASKEANPGVAIVAIINPDNGPGLSRDPNYVAGVNELRAAGVIVLGYDHTSYAARPLSVVIADINSYKSWYNVSGIFFDEMSNVPGNENYYSTLNNYSKSVGLNFTVGNPGSSVPAGYQGTLDVIVTYESQGVPNSTSLASMTSGLPKNDIAVIAYGVDTFNASAVSDVLKYANYVYVTNNTVPNPYGAVMGYFSKLVTLVAGIGHTPTSVPLTVDSVDAAGAPIVGLWTRISSSNGSVVASGYTPLTYSVNSGAGYLVSISNFGKFVFNHWNGGSTNPVMALTVAQGTTLTAFYGANSSAISTNSSTASTSTSQSTAPTSTTTSTPITSTVTATTTDTVTETTTATSTVTAISTTTATSTITATSTTTAISSTTATSTQDLTSTITSVRTTTSTETVTSTVQNTTTAVQTGSRDLTPYLLVGIAIVIAGGLVGLTVTRSRKSN
jgi:hypothetical protein